MADQVILQIVPRRLSVPDGIGDYASLLADALSRQAGIQTIFVQGRSSNSAQLRADRWRDERLTSNRRDALCSTLSALCQSVGPVAVLSHISLYGYQKRGLPLWLATGLATWRRQFRHVPLIGIFHELWVADIRNPLSSSFWLGPAQRALIRRLLQLTDTAIATTERYARRLQDARRSAPCDITVQNVFSSIGEPRAVAALDERPARLAVFGGPGVAGVAQRHGAKLQRLVEAFGISQILDIGARSGPALAAVGGARVLTMGSLPAAEVGALLQTCRLGLLPYGNRAVLGKSTICAAYAAHGVVPVALELSHEDADGLVAGRHYLVADAITARRHHLAVMQERLQYWYQGHSLRAQAEVLISLIAKRKADAHKRKP